MSLFASFQALPSSPSAGDFSAISLPGSRDDFLAKSAEGGPVFLVRDSSPVSYSPAIELQHVSVQFHSTCRVMTDNVALEGQFAIISCSGNAPELYEVFVGCLAAAVAQLPAVASTLDVQRCIGSLLDLFRALGRPSNEEVTGLWGELFVIARSKHVAQALRAWHADQFERFDFSWKSGCLEVKTAVRELRQHDFALEQLQPPLDGVGYIVSILLQPLSGGIGIVDLANDIEASITADPILRQRLWENIISVLGADFSDRLDRRFDASHAERSLAVCAMEDIPAPQKPSDPRVTAVRFRADLSTVVSFVAGSARSILDKLFV